MNEYLLLMHADGREAHADQWPFYLTRLRDLGVFAGGSAIGSGETVRKDGAAVGTTNHIAGYIRIRAEDLAAAKALVSGNPVFEAGGTVEIRELPRTG